MASTTLYPPIIDAYMPAFLASGYCRLYFSMSEYSSTIEDVQSTHLSIIKQSSGQSVVNKTDNAGGGRYRSTGIVIINSAPTAVSGQDNLYYIDILPEDIYSGDSTGWQAGWIYKVQVRLGTVQYNGAIGQAAWLNANASNFSEWSTFCIIKATGVSSVSIPLLDAGISLDLSTLEIFGNYSNTDKDESLYSYQLQLKTSNNVLLEESDVLYTNEYYSRNQISYLFKYELQNNTNYKVILSYSTINKYEDTIEYNITIAQTPSQQTNVQIITIETANTITNPSFSLNSNISEEEEEGRIALKLYLDSDSYFNKKFYIRRASCVDNFTTWEDIKYIECNNQQINALPIIYDYTIENEVWYKYGVQEYNSTTQKRGILNIISAPILRAFQFSYLIGEGGKQLKLKFDNTVGNYNYNYSEGKTETIGGKYLFITRNGNTEYRSFPIAGMISFNMDDRQVFTNANELYVYSDVVTAYQNRKLGIYNFKLEHDFREKVLKFLYDGKAKLFKSPTEGNIIVRLMDLSQQPNQTIDRMIYSFSGNAYEIADNTMENYRKYKFYNIGG